MKQSSRWLAGAVMVTLFASLMAGVGCAQEDGSLKQKIAELENRVTILTKQLEETHKQMERMMMEFQKKMEMLAMEVGKRTEMIAKELKGDRMQLRPMDKPDRFGLYPQDGLQEPPRELRLPKGMQEDERGFELRPEYKLRRPRDMEQDEPKHFGPSPDREGLRRQRPQEESGEELDPLEELLLDDDFEKELERLFDED